MNIVGVQCNSFVDYPTKIAYVVFTNLCNFNCWYCHNRQLLKPMEKIADDEVLNDIKKRAGFIDAVVISGGEPTLQNDLKEFIVKIKNMGLLVKLDTNGTNPTLLTDLLNDNLIDYIAMDIKAPKLKYSIVTECKVDYALIEKSIEVVENCNIKYEFRTTFSPDLNIFDIEEIAKQIANAKRYVINQFVPHEFLPKKHVVPHDKSYVLQAGERANVFVKTEVKGI